MPTTRIPTYQEINDAIKKVADIPSQVDTLGVILADGISLVKNVYDPENDKYELLVQDKKHGKRKSFDSEGNPDCIEDAARCFVKFYNANHQMVRTDYTANFRMAYNEIRTLQTSLSSLLESVPGATVSVPPVTTVKFLRIDTELTVTRNGREIQVFECFFPEGDTKYMCGVRIGNGKDDESTQGIYRSSREALPALIRKYTEEPKPEPIPEQEINRLKYLMSDISSILAKHGASLDAVPGGLRLRTGEPGHGTVAFNLVDKEVK